MQCSQAPACLLAKPMRLALAITCAFSAVPVWAVVEVTSDQTIDATTPPDRYNVRQGATLTGNQANVVTVYAERGSALVLNGGSVDSGTGPLGFGIWAYAADVSLNSVTVVGRDTGLQLTGNAGDAARATVNGGSLTGGQFGLEIQAPYTVAINGTTVEGRQGYGLLAYGGVLTATGATFIGQQSAVLALDNTNGRNGPRSLAFYNSTLRSTQGAAIQVGAPGFASSATVLIADGTRLVGEGGRLVDVQAGSAAQVTVLDTALAGNLLAGDSADLAVNLGQGASLVGDVLAQASSSASMSVADGAVFTGRLQNVANVNLASGGTWQLVENTTQQNLALNGGVVRLGDASAYRTLTVGNLSGNGQFDLRADFATGQADFLEVTGSSSGSHVLNVASSGSDAAVDRIHVVHTADGGADFALNNGRVDLGTWSYTLAGENANSDWYLDKASEQVSPGAASALALFNTAPSVWYGEMTTLRGRMGEIRRDASQTGGWLRAYGNKFNLASAGGVGYQQTQQGLSFGADAPVPIGDGQWRLGVMGGYSQSSLDLQRGTSGEVKSFYVGAYGTWMDEASGYYLDAVVKANRFRNEAKVALSDDTRSKGDYDNYGVGATLEFGRHLALEDGWFVEPYAQLAALSVQGRRFALDNGLRAEGDSARSLLGKAGATLGRRIELGKGRSAQPYVRAAYAHEFAKRNEVSVNDNRFNNDLSGSRGELGAGLAVNLNERLQLHADFDYAKGERMEQPWGVNAGVRYLW